MKEKPQRPKEEKTETSVAEIKDQVVESKAAKTKRGGNRNNRGRN